jgi:hypothetical protein
MRLGHFRRVGANRWCIDAGRIQHDEAHRVGVVFKRATSSGVNGCFFNRNVATRS